MQRVMLKVSLVLLSLNVALVPKESSLFLPTLGVQVAHTEVNAGDNPAMDEHPSCFPPELNLQESHVQLYPDSKMNLQVYQLLMIQNTSYQDNS